MMIRMVPVLLCVLVAAGCQQADREVTASSAADPRPAEVHDAPVPNPATVAVLGLACPLCAHNVDTTLMKVPGVLAVAVDLEAGMLTIQSDAKRLPSRAAIAKAIGLSGVTFDRFVE